MLSPTTLDSLPRRGHLLLHLSKPVQHHDDMRRGLSGLHGLHRQEPLSVARNIARRTLVEHSGLTGAKRLRGSHVYHHNCVAIAIEELPAIRIPLRERTPISRNLPFT